MDVIFELIFELFAEVVLQVIFECLFELGLHSVAEPFRRAKPANPVLATIGYVILGASAGGISLLLFPKQFISIVWLQVLNLFVTPVVAGGVMSSIGRWRSNKDQDLILLDRFIYSAMFALVFALVRFYWGR